MHSESFRPVHALVHIKTYEDPKLAAAAWAKKAPDLDLPSFDGDVDAWLTRLEEIAAKDFRWVAFDLVNNMSDPDRLGKTSLAEIREKLAETQEKLKRIRVVKGESTAADILAAEMPAMAEDIALNSFARHIRGSLHRIESDLQDPGFRLSFKRGYSAQSSRAVREELEMVVSMLDVQVSSNHEVDKFLSPSARVFFNEFAPSEKRRVAEVVSSQIKELQAELQGRSDRSPLTVDQGNRVREVLARLSDPKELANLCEMQLLPQGKEARGARLSLLADEGNLLVRKQQLMSAIEIREQAVKTFHDRTGLPLEDASIKGLDGNDESISKLDRTVRFNAREHAVSSGVFYEIPTQFDAVSALT